MENKERRSVSHLRKTRNIVITLSFLSMFSAVSQYTHQTTETNKQHKDQFVFAVQLHDGRFVVGMGSNPTKRIAALNSGLNKLLPKSLCVNRILDIKPVTEDRTLSSVAFKFCEHYGEDKFSSSDKELLNDYE